MPKIRSFTVQYKLQVIKWHTENGTSIRKTANHFNVDRKRVREWLNNEDHLRANMFGASAKKKHLRAPVPLNADLDMQVK